MTPTEKRLLTILEQAVDVHAKVAERIKVIEARIYDLVHRIDRMESCINRVENRIDVIANNPVINIPENSRLIQSDGRILVEPVEKRDDTLIARLRETLDSFASRIRTEPVDPAQGNGTLDRIV